MADLDRHDLRIFRVLGKKRRPAIRAELPDASGTALRRVLEARRLAAQHLDRFLRHGDDVGRRPAANVLAVAAVAGNLAQHVSADAITDCATKAPAFDVDFDSCCFSLDPA